jgi:hypothetical protein
MKQLALRWTHGRNEPTFATADGDLLCLLLESLDLALSEDRGRDVGSEIVSSIGTLLIGSKLAPEAGLADRERRGQGISPSQFLLGQMPRAARICRLCVLWVMHS